MRAYSQFPSLDFHRLDTPPYGLRTKDMKKEEEEDKGLDLTWSSQDHSNHLIDRSWMSLLREFLEHHFRVHRN